MARSLFSISVRGGRTVRANARRMYLDIRTTGHLNAYNAARHLLSRTRAVVPYENGDLYNAAYAKKVDIGSDRAVWEVGYDTVAVPYAMIQHETPSFDHPTRGPSTEPKTYQFLSRPRDAMEKAYVKTVASDIWNAIRRTRVSRGER